MKLIALIATAVVAVFGLLLTAIVWLAVQRKNLKISLVNLQRSINKHIAEFSAKEKDFEDRILKAKARIGDLELSCTGEKRNLETTKKDLLATRNTLLTSMGTVDMQEERINNLNNIIKQRETSIKELQDRYDEALQRLDGVSAELDRHKRSRHNVRCQHCKVLVKTGETLCKKCEALGYGVTSKRQVAKEELAPIDNDPEPKPLLADAEVGDEVTLRNGKRAKIWKIDPSAIVSGMPHPIFADRYCYQLDGKICTDGIETDHDIISLHKKNKVDPEPYCDGVASKRDASNVC